MGGTQSFEQAVKQIDTIRGDIVKLEEIIQKEGNEIVEYIHNADYTNQKKLCEKLEYRYVDILKNNFPINELKGVAFAQESGVRRIKLAMLVPKAQTAGDLDREKTKICEDIVGLFKRKIDMINNMREYTPSCKSIESKIYEQLSTKMSTANITSEQWEKAYNTLTKFNKNIKTNYINVRSIITRVLRATNHNELDSLQGEFNSLNVNTSTICNAINIDLRTFIEENNLSEQQSPEQKAPAQESPRYPAPGPLKIKLAYNFVAKKDDELSGNEGEIFTVVSKADKDWYKVKNASGNVGYMPANYFEK